MVQEAESTVKDDRRGGAGVQSRSRSPRWRSGRQQSPPPPFRARSRSPLPPPHSLKGRSHSRSPARQRVRGVVDYSDPPVDRGYEPAQAAPKYSRDRSPGRGPPRRQGSGPERREAPVAGKKQQGMYTEDYDSLEISTSGTSQPTRKFDQTSTSLHQRFTFDDSPANFLPKENISVAIERNIPGNARAMVGGQLFPGEVLITRRRGEGEVSLHKREEFLGPQDDDLSERRVIRVARGVRDVRDSGLGNRDNFEVRRGQAAGGRGSVSGRWEADEHKKGKRDDTRSFERYILN